MLQEENSLILIVENSTKAEKIDLARIFEKDFSSKGDGRGLGLYKIQQLLEKYPKTTVSTKSSNYRFTQSLTSEIGHSLEFDFVVPPPHS